MRIFLDSLRQPVLQVLLERSILNYGDDQFLVVPEILARFLVPDPLDHLQVGAFEFLAGKKQSGHDGGFRVGVNHRAGVPHGVSAHEEGRALAFFEFLLRRRQFQVDAFDGLDE